MDDSTANSIDPAVSLNPAVSRDSAVSLDPATPVDRAKLILTNSTVPIDPAVAASLAQAWALLAIAERLEELAEVTREVNQNPLMAHAVPFATKPGITPAAAATPASAETPPVLSRRRAPARVLRVAP